MDMVKLNDICDVRDGTHDSPQYVTEGYPLVTSKNIVDGQIDISNVSYISEEDYEAINKRSNVDDGDILMPMIGTIGRPVIVNKEFEFAIKNVALIKFNQGSKVTPKYIRYILDSNLFKRYVEKENRGGTQKFISLGNIRNFPVPMVSLDKQNEITTILDKLSQLIRNRKAQIELLDNLIKSRFVEVFGESGEEVPLTDYVWFQEGPGVRSVDFRAEGCILLTGSNINDNEISFGYNSDRFISDELAEGKYSHFICDEGDILVVTSAIAPDKFDKKVVVLESEHKYCLNTGIIRFKPNHEHLTNGYFREFLKSMYFKRQVMSEMRGIAQMHFGPSHLKNMTILLPNSLEKQKEFDKFVQHVDKLKLEVQKSLDETQVLFDSLMQEYFG